MNDLEFRVFDQLPNETWFYPVHVNDSTLGAERSTSPSGGPEAGDAHWERRVSVSQA
jgi:hypothetical protein